MTDRIEELHQLADLYNKLTNSVSGKFNTDVSLEDTVNTKPLKELIERKLSILHLDFLYSTQTKEKTEN